MASPRGFSQEGIELINAELAKRGINPGAASGVIAGIMGESGAGLDPQAFNTRDPHGGAGGIVQWNGSRLVGDGGMLSFARAQGIDVNPNNPQDSKRVPLTVQAQFLGHELDTKYAGVAQQLKNTQDPNQALRIWVNQYEVPADKIGAINQRSQYLAPVGTTLNSAPGHPHTLTPPTAGPEYTPTAIAAANPPPAAPPPPTFGESIARGDIGGALKAAITAPTTKDAQGNEVQGKSPLEKIAGAFGGKDDGGQKAAPQIPEMPQSAPVQDPMMGITPAAQQLFQTVQAQAAKPLTWSARPYGSNAGFQGTTLNQTGYGGDYG